MGQGQIFSKNGVKTVVEPTSVILKAPYAKTGWYSECVIDPLNVDNLYIFYSNCDSYYFKNESKQYIQIKSFQSRNANALMIEASVILANPRYQQ